MLTTECRECSEPAANERCEWCDIERTNKRQTRKVQAMRFPRNPNERGNK